MKFWIRIATPITLVMSIAASAQAQYFNSPYGYGMYGGMQSCPYRVLAGDGATSEDDTIKEIKDTITEYTKQKRAKEAEKKRIVNREMRDSRRAVEGVLKEEYSSVVLEHVDNSRDCLEYKGIGKDGDTIAAGKEGDSGVQSAGTLEITAFDIGEWKQLCDGTKPGSVSGNVCSNKKFRQEFKTSFTESDCKKALVDYRTQKLKSQALDREITGLDRQIKNEKDRLSQAKKDAIQARKDEMEDRREEMKANLEAGICENCALSGNGYTYKRPETDWASVAGNVALGGIATALGYSMNKSVISANANLGYPSNPYPAWGYGFPFFGTAMQEAIGGGGGIYGAIGGGVGGGAFGCAGTNGGPFGMQGPFGSMMGNGMWGNPYAMAMLGLNNPLMGGMFNGGMGPWGMNNPMAAMMMNPMAAMMGMPMMGMPIGMAGALSMAGAMGMPMTGMPMGMAGAMGMPMTGMPMTGMPIGMAGALSMAGAMGMPMTGMPMGMAGAMGMPMMGNMGGAAGSLGMLQMQQQMMQMQMSQYQMYMQQQQAVMQQTMQRQQVAASVQSEIYSLMYKLQMLQYGGLSGGLGGGLSLSGGLNIGFGGALSTGVSGVPIGGLTSTNGYSTIGTPIGPSPVPVGSATAVTPIGTGR